LTLRRCAGAAELVIEDDGRDFDPTKVVANTPPENLTEAEPGGMGLNLMRHYCADIRYERVRERNRLTLRFPLLQSSS
jgi:serine/threonine-protein kinase RsbW